MARVWPDVGPVLTVPLESSYTQMMGPNQGETGLELLVFRFREDLAWQFGLDCSYWSRVKTDLHMAGSKLRCPGGQKNDGLECYRAIASGQTYCKHSSNHLLCV